MNAGKVFRKLALLAMLAQLWVAVPSAMALGMSLQVAEHTQMQQHEQQDDAGMICCEQQVDCHCDQGACMLHPVLHEHTPLLFHELAHISGWLPPSFILSRPAGSLYRPPIA